MDALRLRQEEKESFLSKKSQQISELTDEKSTQQGEITDLKDMLDVKERKVNVLQKKVGKSMPLEELGWNQLLFLERPHRYLLFKLNK